jgi:hypothetical protein
MLFSFCSQISRFENASLDEEEKKDDEEGESLTLNVYCFNARQASFRVRIR